MASAALLRPLFSLPSTASRSATPCLHLSSSSLPSFSVAPPLTFRSVAIQRSRGTTTVVIRAASSEEEETSDDIMADDVEEEEVSDVVEVDEKLSSKPRVKLGDIMGMKYMKLGSKTNAFQADGNIRFVASELVADIVINFPLLSKSLCLQKLVAATNEDSNDEIDISDIPGGPAALEVCAKFCYGMIATLNAYNVVSAQCAAEYLEMHETVEKWNLIYKIEVFLSSSILRSWKDSIIVHDGLYRAIDMYMKTLRWMDCFHCMEDAYIFMECNLWILS